MSNIKINDCVYKVHPVYNLYASDENGNIIHLVKQVPSIGQKHKSGYMLCMVRKHRQNGQKCHSVHRFVYECFNGIIPDGKVIDHVNNIKDDNRLCNLQLMSHQENCKKSPKITKIKSVLKPPIVIPMKFHIIIVCMLFTNILVLMLVL